jgi:hypothetical protein
LVATHPNSPFVRTNILFLCCFVYVLTEHSPLVRLTSPKVRKSLDSPSEQVTLTL